MSTARLPAHDGRRPRLRHRPDHIVATRAFYDAVAEDYADHFRDVFAAQHLELALLAGFAGLVGAGGAGGEVADLGCGPG
ncbi:hypothetical protein ABT134_07595 [Streptomyces hirsutus]